jgi:hypothetical protein
MRFSTLPERKRAKPKCKRGALAATIELLVRLLRVAVADKS